MREKLYKFIEEILMGIDGTPIKHVDLWNNQIAFIEEEAPFATPAVFIEFAPIRWNNIGGGEYSADVSVRLHVVTDSRAGKWSDAVGAFRLTGSILGAMNLAYDKTEQIGEFVLTDSVTDSLFGELMHNIETYTTNVLECA